MAHEGPWARDARAVCEELATDVERGLEEAEVEARRRRYGPNRLREIETRGWAAILVAQLKTAVVALLVVGAGVAFAFGQHVEGAAIAGVVVLNTLLGFVTEMRAVRSMEALRRLGEVTATVRRAGALERIGAVDLVPGDVVLFEAGDVVTADLRVVDASALRADESPLTGESVPCDKGVAPVAPETPLAERGSMLFKGTTITHGAGEGVVVGTGMSTELGRISALVEEAEDEETPLEQRIAALGRQLMFVSIGFVALATGLGVARGQDPFLMVETAIALAVATVPEGLPVVATIALARGMWRMARRHALVEKLPAVETLGSTSLILTDKTGTLTENRMRAVALAVGERVIDLEGDEALGPTAELALRIGAQASEATLDGVGDPLEVALVEAAASRGLRRDELLEEEPELREIAFDPNLKMSATEHRAGGRVRVAVKGAPESVIARASRAMAEGGEPKPLDRAERERWLAVNEECATRGLRVLALATRDVDRPLEPPEVYEDLTLVALVGLLDPPRARVHEALARARAAGVRVVMATGDQPATAAAVAERVGVVSGTSRPIVGEAIPALDGDEAAVRRALDADVIARATPEQKLRLLRLHQREGTVVAMLGDGVNDAPALRQADIGVAMGERGTQVARQAADMVLEDDSLDSVVAAIGHGRVIFANLRAFVVYLLGCNLAEILVVGLAAALGWALPVLPLQVLFLNLLTDVFPATALGVSEGEPGVMSRPPRDPDEALLGRREWSSIVVHAGLLTLAVLAAFGAAEAIGLELAEARTVAFATLGLGQLAHVLNMAERGGSPFVNEVTKNPWVWGAIALCAALMAVGLWVPGISDVLSTVPLSARGGALVTIGSLAPLLVVQLGRALRRLARRSLGPPEISGPRALGRPGQ